MEANIKGKKQNHAMTRKSLFFKSFILFTVLIAVGCGSKESNNQSSSDSKETASSVSTTQIKLDACEVLKAIDLAAVLGEAVGEAQPQIQMENEESAISQCGYETISGKKSVTLFLRYSTLGKNPETRAEFEERSGNFLGMGEEAAAAIKQGKEIAGLGDFAFTYQMFGLNNLMVFWDQHYQMTVMVDGFANDAEAVESAKVVALRILEKLGK